MLPMMPKFEFMPRAYKTAICLCRLFKFKVKKPSGPDFMSQAVDLFPRAGSRIVMRFTVIQTITTTVKNRLRIQSAQRRNR
jgi:hypothetical protein